MGLIDQKVKSNHADTPWRKTEGRKLHVLFHSPDRTSLSNLSLFLKTSPQRLKFQPFSVLGSVHVALKGLSVIYTVVYTKCRAHQVVCIHGSGEKCIYMLYYFVKQYSTAVVKLFKILNVNVIRKGLAR